MSPFARFIRGCRPTGKIRAFAGIVAGLVWLGAGAFPVSGADIEASRQEFLSGHYTHCVRLCEQALRENEPGESWRLLLAETYLTLGKYPEAQAVMTSALERYSSSLRARWLGYLILQQCDQSARAEMLLEEIIQLANTRSYAYRDAASLVVIGKAALLTGADSRLVLEKLFDPAKTTDPDCREAYLAGGELALEKHDYELAARNFRQGLEKFPKDADFHGGLARAYAPSGRPEMFASAAAALQLNTNHIPSLLLLADNLIDSEDYAGAEKLLARVVAINPWHPEAWAYRAVLKNLNGEGPGETDARATALRFGAKNPRVDYLIGAKLSQKYRFAEGAASQRRALQLNPGFGPSTIQLAQDLLRLGEETEGWRLAEDAYRSDGYNVTAYNLVTLKESMAKFQTLTNRDLVVRLSPREAAIYGTRVLDLLSEARAKLGAKYDLKLDAPVVVEIFPESKDFAVRTFGLPGDSSYLGVCFGRVITANSPATQVAHPVNWQAMLWHEFTHVVTLQLTRNKMPRWLSEGISVFEERQAQPAWGQRMNARYRGMILEDELVPLGKLSAAFLSPKDLEHLGFAYYESSLAVEFLVQRFGLDALKQVLGELGRGIHIDKTMEKHFKPMPQLEKEFAAFARERAQKMGPSLDWTKPPAKVLAGSNSDALEDWNLTHPNNFWGLTEQAKRLILAKQYEAAKAPLTKLIEAYPENTGADNASLLLAEVQRALNSPELERQTLARLAMLDADAVEVFMRLMELSAAAQDWPAVLENAERYLAVDPLVAPPYRFMARACEALNKTQPAIKSYETLLTMDPPDPADLHYRLARLLRKAGDPAAKRHVLQALEEAPRFGDAHRLLLEITRAAQPIPQAATP